VQTAASNQPINVLDNEIIDLFLCHNGADKAWVEELAEQVESETFDGTSDGRRLRVFFDKWDIDKGENILLKLNEGLSKARYVAVVLSPEMLQAPWPAFEWTHVVSDDPTNRRGRLIPIYLKDYSETLKTRAEFPAPFKALNWIDFRRKSEFKQSFLQLVAKLRDQKPTRGRQRSPIASVAPLIPPADRPSDSPDAVNEVILGNLLPVSFYPQTVWFASTSARTAKYVFDKVKHAMPFELQEAKLFTFADLSNKDEPLRVVIDPTTIQTVRLADWKNDPVKWRWAISLFNRCLRNRLFQLPITKDDKGRFFFRTNQDNTDRVWQNSGDPKRTVAAKKVNSDGSQSFWVHHGAWLTFMTLGNGLYLTVEPSYVFTSDGKTPLSGKSVGPLSVQWGGKERNAAILRHITFWGRTLAGGKLRIEIPTGGQLIVASAVPAQARASFGVAEDTLAVRALLEQVEDELEYVAAELGERMLKSVSEEEDDAHE
jgi:hypothetical protein